VTGVNRTPATPREAPDEAWRAVITLPYRVVLQKHMQGATLPSGYVYKATPDGHFTIRRIRPPTK
jgi:hypothetical protein